MKSRNFVVKKSILYVFLFFLVAIVVLPLLWMLLNSIKTLSELFNDSLSMPEIPMFKNYISAWNLGISKYFLNSVFVSTIAVSVTTLLGALAAYGLTRFTFPGQNIIFFFILGGLMLSEQVALVPLYKLLQKLQLYNTYGAIILPYIAFKIPFAVFLMRSYFLSIPREIEESAYIDGCNSFKIFYKIILPISKPILASSAIMTLIFVWNEFLFSLVFLEDKKIMTIPIGLMTFKGQLRTDWTIMMAGIVISALPMIILFLSMQKQFIKGLTAGSVKG